MASVTSCVVCMRRYLLCVHLVWPAPASTARRSSVAGHTSAQGRMRGPGERGSGLYPGPARGSNARGRGVALGGERLLATICSPGTASLKMWDAARPSDSEETLASSRCTCHVVGSCWWSRAVGSWEAGRARRRTSPTVPQVLPAHWMRAAGRRTKYTPLSGSSFVGNPLRETYSSRWVLRAEGRTPRFLRRETLEKPEIEDEYRHIDRRSMATGFGPFRPKCLIHFDKTLSGCPASRSSARHIRPEAGTGQAGARSQHTGCGHMPNSQRPRLLKPDGPGPPRRRLLAERRPNPVGRSEVAGRPSPLRRAKRSVGTALAAIGIAAGLGALVAALVLLAGDCAGRSNGQRACTRAGMAARCGAGRCSPDRQASVERTLTAAAQTCRLRLRSGVRMRRLSPCRSEHAPRHTGSATGGPDPLRRSTASVRSALEHDARRPVPPRRSAVRPASSP